MTAERHTFLRHFPTEYPSRFGMSVFFLLLISIVLAAAPAHAVRPDEMLANPALEARAREIGRELRCLVCRNQSIDDSDADLAHDLRVLVRERITAGDSNDQVIAYVRSRYGDFVLLRPPFEIGTLLLWGGPLLILLLGGFGVVAVLPDAGPCGHVGSGGAKSRGAAPAAGGSR